MLELTILLLILLVDDALEKDALSEDSEEKMGEAKRATG